MKGQWFLISAVIISGALVAIFGLLEGYFEIDASKIALMDEDYYFSNVKDRLNEAVFTSTCEDVDKNLDGFIYFTKQRLAGMGYYLFVNRSKECITEFHDSFEQANTLWEWGTRWSRSSGRAEATGPVTDSALAMADSIDLRGAGLNFSWFIESTLTGSDYLCLDLYDGTWNEYKCLIGDTTEGVWISEFIKLNSTDEFKLRFRAKLQAANRHVNVDNVNISYPTAGFGMLLASDRMTVYENVNPEDLIQLGCPECITDEDICRNADNDLPDCTLCNGLDIAFGPGYKDACCTEWGFCCPC